MPSTITPADLHARLQAPEPVDLIDVRTPAEYGAVHVQGTRLIPLDTLDPEAVKSSRPEDAAGPILVLCKAGGRAAKAADQLNAAGCEAVVVEGGTDACVNAGLPVQRGEAAMSLERQVRIAAGSFVLIGTLLGAFVHPAFLILPGFVGTGLVFAGITDTCGMGMLLARMPWNR